MSYYCNTHDSDKCNIILNIFFLFSDLKKRSENILYSENKFYFTLSRLKIHYISTSIFYSPIVHVTYEPSCLRYRYLLYGDSYLTISYLTNFHYLYEAIPLVGHASNGIFSFTYGCLNLPLIKEYKVTAFKVSLFDYITRLFDRIAPPKCTCAHISWIDFLEIKSCKRLITTLNIYAPWMDTSVKQRC